MSVLCKAFINQITVSEEDIVRVEAATRDQSQSPRWHHERQCRITSSVFGLFCKGCVSTCKVKTLLYDTDTTSKASSSSILWGKLHESTAFEQYRRSLQLAPNEQLRHCGIYISKHGFLAASPDGVVTTDNVKSIGTIEIKCPYSARNMSVRDGCQSVKSFACEILDGQVRLKTSHPYYYQIQGAMAIAGVEWCDFIVWTTVDMHVERISFNLLFWNSCFSKLQSIYSSYILPEIIYPRIPSDLDIIEYDFPSINRIYFREP